MKFKITRQNYVKVILVAYGIIIASILLVKWSIFFIKDQENRQKKAASMILSPSFDHNRHLQKMKMIIAREGRELIEAAAQQLTGDDVVRMSDFNAAVEKSVRTFFDADSRRLRAALREGQREAESADRTVRAMESRTAAEDASAGTNIRPNNEPGVQPSLNSRVYARLAALVEGFKSVVQVYNEQHAFGRDLVFQTNLDPDTFAGDGLVRYRLARVLFPSGNEWDIDYDASIVEGDFLGGVDVIRRDKPEYSIALVLIEGRIRYLGLVGGQPQVLTGEGILQRIQDFLEKELAEAQQRASALRAVSPL